MHVQVQLEGEYQKIRTIFFTPTEHFFRNGGHASPIIYNEYFRLKKAHGAAVALQILRFRLAHITALIEVTKAEGLSGDSQARLVDNFDAFLQPGFFKTATDELKAFIKEVPQDIGERFGVVEDRDAIEVSSSLFPSQCVRKYINLFLRSSNWRLQSQD